MVTRLSDNREYLAMSVAAADAIFQTIAMLTLEATAKACEHEKNMAAIKATAVADASKYEAQIRPLQATLKTYIEAHPERFLKPRMRQTEFGKYGKRTATNLEKLDEAAVLASIKSLGIPALIVSEKIDWKAVEKAISDGAEIAGAEIRTGELVTFTVDKKLIDRIKK